MFNKVLSTKNKRPQRSFNNKVASVFIIKHWKAPEKRKHAELARFLSDSNIKMFVPDHLPTTISSFNDDIEKDPGVAALFNLLRHADKENAPAFFLAGGMYDACVLNAFDLALTHIERANITLYMNIVEDNLYVGNGYNDPFIYLNVLEKHSLNSLFYFNGGVPKVRVSLPRKNKIDVAVSLYSTTKMFKKIYEQHWRDVFSRLGRPF